MALLRGTALAISTGMKKSTPVTANDSSKTANAMTFGRHRRGAAFAAGCALVLAAVLGSGCSEQPSLTVNIEAPENAKIDVVVSGPNNFKKTINTTTTFTDIAMGQYKVELVESRKRISRPIIDDTFLGSVDQPLPRVEEPTTVTIKFDREPGSGHVWVPVAGEDKVFAFSAAAFEQKGLPTFELATPPGSGPDAIAFRLGDLWVAFRKSGQVAQYDAMSLAQPGVAPNPMKTIPNLGRPSGLAFDKTGDLFVSEGSKHVVTRFGSLATKPTAAWSMRVEGEPNAIAFDSDGAMFVATTDPPAIRIYDPADSASARPALRGSIVGAKTKLVAPSGLAFAADGTLWIANGDKAPAVRFEPHALYDVNGDTDVEPSAMLNPTAGESFAGVAFDKQGHGWFTAGRAESNGLRCGTAMETNTPALGDAVSLGSTKPSAFGSGMFAFNPPPVPSPIRR